MLGLDFWVWLLHVVRTRIKYWWEWVVYFFLTIYILFQGRGNTYVRLNSWIIKFFNSLTYYGCSSAGYLIPSYLACYYTFQILYFRQGIFLHGFSGCLPASSLQDESPVCPWCSKVNNMFQSASLFNVFKQAYSLHWGDCIF